MFNPRCRYQDHVEGDRCTTERPDLARRVPTGTRARCHIDPRRAARRSGPRRLRRTCDRRCDKIRAASSRRISAADAERAAVGPRPAASTSRSARACCSARSARSRPSTGSSFDVARRRDARPGRRVRLRQVDDRPGDHQADRADRRHDHLRRPGTSRSFSRGQMRPLRRDIQMIFQDPYSSLNPRHTIGTIVGAPFRIQGTKTERGIKAEVQQLLERVGLNPEHYNRYPHEFSGGQRQRIGIARAIALQPEADRLRRAGLGARRVDPGAGRQPARGPAERVQPRLRVHRARPVGRAAHLRPRRRHVPRQDHGAGRPRRALQRAAAPVHARADVGRAGARPGEGEGRASASCSTATCPARSTRRPAACSTPAARSTARCSTDSQKERCRTEVPALEEKAPGHFAHCHFPTARADVAAAEDDGIIPTVDSPAGANAPAVPAPSAPRSRRRATESTAAR